MKITIVTVYNSENSGSFLQAYALEHVLTSQGHEVQFLCRGLKGTSHELLGKDRFFEIARNALRLNVLNIFLSLKRWVLYEKLIRRFTVCKINSREMEGTTLFVFGSDTIWNFNDDYFRSKADVLTGFTLKDKKLITYAASAANSSKELFAEVLAKYNNLKSFSRILVRDTHTADLVSSVCHKPVEIVLDPTFLCKPSVYDSLAAKIKIKKNYLLIYYAGYIDAVLQENVQEYVKRNNMEVVSMMYHYDWCATTYVGAPQYFIPLFKNATAVLTNTFHGTAFSLIYNKAFAVKDNGKNKVKELLSKFEVEDHMFDSNEDFAKCISIKWREATSWLMDKERESSLSVLFSSIQ